LPSERTLADLNWLYDKLELSSEARAVVERARIESPTRVPTGSGGNVIGFTTSPHTNLSIPFEAKTSEFYRAVQLNFRSDVIEYYAQPPSRRITYKTSEHKNVTVWKTHDFLIITESWIGYEECKLEKKIGELNQKSADLFVKDETGRWIAPAYARDANLIGLEFSVFCPDIFDVTFVRNADFIRDYMWRDIPDEHKEQVDRITAYLKRKKIDYLSNLIAKFAPDAVYFAIANKHIYINWYTSLLCTPEVTEVYGHALIDEIESRSISRESDPTTNPSIFKAGTKVVWLDQEWTLVAVRENLVAAVNAEHRVLKFSLSDVIGACRGGDLRVISKDDDQKARKARELLMTISTDALADALDRFEKLQRYRDGEVDIIPDRTASDWIAKCREAEFEYGNPILGLVHKNALKGNRNRKANGASIDLAIQVLAGDYESLVAKAEARSYANYIAVCGEKHITPISRTTFNEYKRNRDQVGQKRKRYGDKVAYQHQGPVVETDLSTPPNGDRAWELGHIDHTPVELETISGIDNCPLGTSWLTFLTDAYSRYILAMWLSYYAPSVVSLLMVIRDCVRRWERLPNKLMVDRGPEFKSVWLDTFLSKSRIDKYLRPTAEPRYGSVPERIFGTLDTTFTHQLFGNTENAKLFRMRSKSHNPKDHAIWTPDILNEELENWAFNVYPTLKNTGVGETPQSRMDRSIATAGTRDFKRIAYDQNFLFATMPDAPNKPTRKVRKGTISMKYMSYRGRYESINQYNGLSGEVRHEPLNPSLGYIHLDNRWMELTCTSDVMRELMERQIRCSHLELSARMARAKKTYREVQPELIELVERLGQKESELIAAKSSRASHNASTGATGNSENVIKLPVVRPMKVTKAVPD
jgi:transposase InsO family protein